MAAREAQEPSPRHEQLLRRIEQRLEQLDEQLQDLEARLPELADAEATPATRRRRIPRKPR
jgi:prefoldin subunit 5